MEILNFQKNAVYDVCQLIPMVIKCISITKNNLPEEHHIQSILEKLDIYTTSLLKLMDEH